MRIKDDVIDIFFAPDNSLLPVTSVKCGSSSMTVNIDQRLVQGDASGVHFRNHSCFGEDSSTPNEITLTTDYSQCGTSFEV